MAVGLRIRNTETYIQIDQNYKNYEFVRGGIHNFDGSVSRPPMKIPLETVREDSIYAFLPVTTGLIVCPTADASGVISVIPNQVAGQMKWYQFAKPVYTPISGGVGLVVRNEITGEQVFHSKKNYMRVLENFRTDIKYNFQTGQGGTVLKSYAPGKEVATVFTLVPWHTRAESHGGGGSGSPPAGVIQTYAVSHEATGSTSNVFLRYFYLIGAGGPIQVGNWEAAQQIGGFMTIDVTGLV